MKARTVMVTLQLTTDRTVKELRDKRAWQNVMPENAIVEQVQVNVAQPPPKGTVDEKTARMRRGGGR